MHQPYDIWIEENPHSKKTPYRVQLIKYVGEFPTLDAAERFVETVKKTRKALGLK